MDCLIGKIGVLGYSEASYYKSFGARPKLFINSLPGISLKSIDSLVEAEQRDYLGVFRDAELRSAERFKVDIISRLSKRYKLNNIQSNIDLGYEIGSAETKVASRFKGVVIDLDCGLGSSREYKSSALQGIYVHEVNLFISNISANATSNILISDYYNYSVTDSYFIATVISNYTAGIIGYTPYKIPVRKFFPFRKAVIQLDTSNVSLFSLPIPLSTSDYETHTIKGFYSTNQLNSSNSTAVYSNDAHGVSVVYSVRCKFDTLVCNNLDLFLPAWWYLLGSELTVERLFSSKINRWTIKEKEGQELKAYYDKQYEDILDSVCDSIDLDLSDSCIDCNDNFIVKESNFF